MSTAYTTPAIDRVDTGVENLSAWAWEQMWGADGICVEAIHGEIRAKNVALGPNLEWELLDETVLTLSQRIPGTHEWIEVVCIDVDEVGDEQKAYDMMLDALGAGVDSLI